MSIYFSFLFLSKLLAIDLESISVLLLCGKQILILFYRRNRLYISSPLPHNKLVLLNLTLFEIFYYITKRDREKARCA